MGTVKVSLQLVFKNQISRGNINSFIMKKRNRNGAIQNIPVKTEFVVCPQVGENWLMREEKESGEYRSNMIERVVIN